MKRSEFHEERTARLVKEKTGWGAAVPVKLQAAKESADGHSCYSKTKSGMYGEALSYCFEADDGLFWVGNFEYESAVEFCPFCGTQSKIMNVDGKLSGVCISSS